MEHINPALCTHLIYTFFGIHTDGSIRVLDPYLDLETNWGRGNIKKFNALKKNHPHLKTLAAVGGWNEASLGFSQVSFPLLIITAFKLINILFYILYRLLKILQKDDNSQMMPSNFVKRMGLMVLMLTGNIHPNVMETK